MTTSLARTVLAELRAVAEPERAPAMQAYMKSAMPYLGVSSVPLRQTCKAVFAGLAWSDAAAWQADVLAIWRSAQFREQRYAAIELTGLRAARGFQTTEALPMYEEMAVTGAWWDHVDNIAGPRFWPLLQNDRAAMTAAMRAWAHDDDMWKRRSAIICQLHAKEKTDLDLLYAAIEPSLESKEFFLRKAIGWALRQYARIDPDEVRRYVKANESRLSGLSRREALKRIGA
ncbi:DNA alkylation repair protein [Novosphingobium sp. JCM 18896]|uniref:DNA alkylation repair protein n=1 Tax=Novosphingobium sp. JCM 18896 TaxID=2989731 RepID=UPI00222149D7|nr:DNA alkylation repair protein [Novosphingobium sp. JCM 18896]MCW1430459.1 DNA alkylation repair protein [Novosphingobium sp. JCM 18896]